MPKAGIAIDDWKLPMFSKALVDAGFKYEQGPGLTQGTYMLRVEYESSQTQHLAQVVHAANKACAKVKRP